MRSAAVLFVILFFGQLQAQSPKVPGKMEVAGITLSIRDDARKEIQKDVDALTQSPKYFNIKVERAKTYFPIIEKIFKEENVPDDFKFLVLQESALIADAVSVSNAVGFWQFKDFTAEEVGMRVDKEIDERMNIVSSSRGAARYLKKNNHYFNNWIYALQAYQMGAGGVMRAVKDYQGGTKHMEIDGNTYWYVKKFLAHKVAFEDAVKGKGEIQVISFENHKKKSLHDLAKEISVDEESLKEYNKWVRKGSIPDDKKYVVMIPVTGEAKRLQAAIAKSNPETHHYKERIEAKPAIARGDVKYVNGIPAITAVQGETAAALAARAGVRLSSFLKYNDLSISDRIEPGKLYFTRKKKSKGATYNHVALGGESLWDVSQQYGIQLRKLRKLNPGINDRNLRTGTEIFLMAQTPENQTMVSEVETLQVDESDTFNWSVNPEGVEASTSKQLPQTIEVSQVKEDQAIRAEESDTVAQTISENPAKHIVLAGETLYAISKKYNLTVMELKEWNNLDLQAGIQPGQVLWVGKPDEQKSAEKARTEVLHEVKPTETLYSVARQYGVTIKEIMEWNGKEDFGVKPGEKLKIFR